MSTALRWQLLALLAFIGFLIYLLAPVLTPFAIAALLAYLGDPLVDRLEERGFSRNVSVLMVFLAMILSLILVLLILIPMLERQVTTLFNKLPTYLAWIEHTALPWVADRLGVDTSFLREGEMADKLVQALQQHWQTAGGVAATVLGSVGKSGLAILGWIANLVLIPVVTFYLLRDWDRLMRIVDDLLPRHIEPVVLKLARESDSVLSAFLRGQLSVMLALGTIYSLGLLLIGLDLGLLIGMGAGLLSFIPYLGTFLGLAGGLIAAFVQFGDWFHPAMVLMVFMAGQTLEGFVLTPYLVGDKIGLHPVAVIFAIMAGGQLFGFLGVLLALPIAAVIVVVLRYVYERYRMSELYGADASSALEGNTEVSIAGMDGKQNAPELAASETVPVAGVRAGDDRRPDV
jgi:predicted PurR-regulated permease PerM